MVFARSTIEQVLEARSLSEERVSFVSEMCVSYLALEQVKAKSSPVYNIVSLMPELGIPLFRPDLGVAICW